jgi:hypothetical protein
MRDTEIDVPRYRVRWTVQSKSRLERVGLTHRHDGRVVERKEALAKAGELVDANDVWDVDLRPGLNELQVDAVNDGGLQTASVRVSYIEKPVRVEIDGLELRRAQPGVVMHSEDVRDGTLVFAKADDGLARLHGRVIWQVAKDRPADSALTVRTWVNGFQQIPTRLRPAEDRPNESIFEADMVLNRVNDNHILIKVPDLKEKKESLKRCLVRHCAKPVTEQRLNLLVVGAEAADKKHLFDRALVALGAEALANKTTVDSGRARASAEGFGRATGAFQSIGEVVVLPGSEADKYAVRDGFFRIRNAIEQGDPDRPVNDIVVFYFQGKEAIRPTGAGTSDHFLLVNDTDEDYRISCDQLATLFGESVGAQIILLDVAREPGQLGVLDPQADKIRFWPLAGDESDLIAVFRSAWLGPNQQPREVQLINMLQEAVAKFGVLGKIGKEIRTRYSEIRNYPVRYDPHLPAELADLKIGREATSDRGK